MTGPRSLQTDDEAARDALLGAFLDGELSADDESALLARLEAEPELQDALDTLAAEMAAMQRALAAGLPGVDDALIDDGLAVRVLVEVAPEVVGADGVAALAGLVLDGEASAAQAARLDELFGADARVAAEVADIAGVVDVARAGLDIGAVGAVAPALQASAARVGEVVAAVERVRALAAGVADGMLDDAERGELERLVADADVAVAFDDAVLAQQGGRMVGEALRVVADDVSCAAYAARAGQAALQAIAATTPAVQPARAPARPTTTPWASLVALLRRGFIPVAVGSAAVLAFTVLRGAADDGGTADDAASGAVAVQQAFVDIVAPQLLAKDTTVLLAQTDAPVLADNTAEVQALDATSKTLVFETPESHITVIWVDDLGAAEGQGT